MNKDHRILEEIYTGVLLTESTVHDVYKSLADIYPKLPIRILVGKPSRIRIGSFRTEAEVIYGALNIPIPGEDGGYDEDDPPNLEEADNLVREKIIEVISPFGWIIADFGADSGQGETYYGYLQIILQKDISRLSRSEQPHFFHITLSKNIPSIKKDGLVAKSSTRTIMTGYGKKIFLFNGRTINKNNIEELKTLASNLQGTSVYDPMMGVAFIRPEKYEDISILKVELPSNIQKRLDTTAMKGSIQIDQNIPPDKITVIYTGPIDGIKTDLFR